MTDSIHNKTEIIQHINEAFDQVASFIKSITSAQFMQAPEGKWPAGQHLEHLIRSTQPINALLLGDIAHIKVFGQPERTTWNYDELVTNYQKHLADGAKARGQFVPSEVTPYQKAELIESFIDAKEQLIKAVEQWEDDQLDNYCIPHPLLGKLSVREMLFFTIYHTRHHMSGITRLLRNILN